MSDFRAGLVRWCPWSLAESVQRSGAGGPAPRSTTPVKVSCRSWRERDIERWEARIAALGSRAHVEKGTPTSFRQPRRRPPVSRRFLTRGFPFSFGLVSASTLVFSFGVLTRAAVIAQGECALCAACVTAIEHQAISEND